MAEVGRPLGTRAAGRLLQLAILGALGLSIGSAVAVGRRLSEAEMCARADWVIIGTVEDRESFIDPAPDVYISSVITFRVEAVAHGRPPPEPVVRFKIRGGVVGDVRQNSSGVPQANEGERYLLLMGLPEQPIDDGSGIAPAAILRWWEMTPEVPVPPEGVMGAIWTEHCATEGTPPGDVRPTEQFLKYIPQYVLEWCQHY